MEDVRFFSFIQSQGQIPRWLRGCLSGLLVHFTVELSLICLCTRPSFIWCFLPEPLEGKVRNLDSLHCYSGLQTRGQMCFHSMDAADRGYKCVSVCPCLKVVQRWSEVHEQGQKSTVSYSPEDKTPFCSWFCPPCTKSKGYKKFFLLQWVLCYICAHPQPVHWGCPGGNAVTDILQPNLQ